MIVGVPILLAICFEVRIPREGLKLAIYFLTSGMLGIALLIVAIVGCLEVWEVSRPPDLDGGHSSHLSVALLVGAGGTLALVISAFLSVRRWRSADPS